MYERRKEGNFGMVTRSFGHVDQDRTYHHPANNDGERKDQVRGDDRTQLRKLSLGIE